MGSGFGRAIIEDTEKAGGEENKDGDVPRVKRTRQVSQRSDFSQAPWSILLRKPEVKQRDSR